MDQPSGEHGSKNHPTGKEKRNERQEDSLRGLWDNIKRANVHSTGSQKEKRQKPCLKK